MTRSHLWGVATSLANTFFRECTQLLLSFLPLQICVNPRLSAAKKSFPYFLFFRFPSFLRLSYFKPLNSYEELNLDGIVHPDHNEVVCPGFPLSSESVVQCFQV